MAVAAVGEVAAAVDAVVIAATAATAGKQAFRI
jgi:hypothetical protein